VKRRRQIFEWVLFAVIVFAILLTIASLTLRTFVWLGWL
jgi:hypothetical protein